MSSHRKFPSGQAIGTVAKVPLGTKHPYHRFESHIHCRAGCLLTHTLSLPPTKETRVECRAPGYCLVQAHRRHLRNKPADGRHVSLPLPTPALPSTTDFLKFMKNVFGEKIFQRWQTFFAWKEADLFLKCERQIKRERELAAPFTGSHPKTPARPWTEPEARSWVPVWVPAAGLALAGSLEPLSVFPKICICRKLQAAARAQTGTQILQYETYIVPARPGSTLNLPFNSIFHKFFQVYLHAILT